MRLPWASSLALVGLLGLLGVTPMACAAGSKCPPQAAVDPTAATESAPTAEASAAPEVSVAPVVMLLVRHAEKASDGSADPPLTDEGRTRAQCLATLLQDLSPTHLFATQYQRTRATLEPLAAASGHAVTVIEAQDGAKWTQAFDALPPGSRVVVAGHSNTLPQWVAGLGGSLSALDDKGNIPHDEYARLVHVVRDGQGEVVVYTTDYCVPAVGSAP
ncbi:MAG: histidine phosphatase family protein [Deltaproteobacteria bacterium]|nr:histidine phosphatase family protein [Deltaproteobacteria bacterium]